MNGDDDDETSRPTSQSSRKRWETHTKESFEGCLATETPSPVTRNPRGLSSASKLKATSDPSLIYGAPAKAQEPPRVKSAIKKHSRETEAELKHALKMAEGRRARGSSATSDKLLLKESKIPMQNNGGKIPVPIPRHTAKSGRHSRSEATSQNIPQTDEDKINSHSLKQDDTSSDSLRAKHAMILHSAMSKKNYKNVNSEESGTTDETVSKKEGYESDEGRGLKSQSGSETVTIERKKSQAKFVRKPTPSAPAIDSSDNSSLNGNNLKFENRSPVGNGSRKHTPDHQIASSNKDITYDESANQETTDKTQSRRKRSRRRSKALSRPSGSGLSSTPESHISLQLRKLRDDIVDSSDLKYLENGQFNGNSASSDFATKQSILLSRAQSKYGEDDDEPSLNTIYCEGYVLSKDGKKYVKQKLKHSYDNEERFQPPTLPASRATLAVFLQTSFRTFSVFCQGLLAGVSMAHCFMVFLMSDSWDGVAQDLPPRLCHVLYTIIIFLTFVCFVASCDRCDLCSSDGGLLTHHSIHIPWSAGLYLASLSISVACTRTEVLLAHRHEPLPPPQQPGGIGWYAWLSLARTVANIVAWSAVVPDPHTDVLLAKLNQVVKLESKQHILGNESEC